MAFEANWTFSTKIPESTHNGQPVINIPQGDQSLCIDLSMFSLQGVNSRKASLVKNKITLPNLLLH